jgi:hypothetical protein
MRPIARNTWLIVLLCAAAVVGAARGRTPTIPHHAAWRTYTDKLAGGKSTIQVSGQLRNGPTPSYFTHMQGTLVRYLMFTFAGMQSQFEPGGAPLDARGYTGIEFWVRGDGHSYMAQVTTASVKDFNYFTAPLPTTSQWTLVKVPFARLHQVIPGRASVPWTGKDVTGVSFQANGFVGTFSLEVGNISLY